MPVTLPAGTSPTPKVLTEDEILVAGERHTEWRFELLDHDENLVGMLDGAVSGSVDWSASASIKGGGQLNVADTGQDVDWLGVRIRPVARIKGIDRDLPCGIWLPDAPVDTWGGHGRSWTVDLLDKATILDGDIWADPSTGEPGSFVAEAGSTALQVVAHLIEETGESAAAIGDDSTTITTAMMWEAGTTRLRIINDILDAAGFFSLTVDERGQFRAAKYVPPADRQPRFENVQPFAVGDTSLMALDFAVERDFGSVPNRWVCITGGTDEEEALVSVATNENADSPFSYQARGRWITRVDNDVEAVDQQALDTITTRRLISAMSVSAKIPVSHLWLPGLAVNDVVPVRIPKAGVDILATVARTSATFDPVGMCTSDLVEVVSL